jgi:phenylpropionate dioxygenase-like ring-hydroxylating dioxygenase large terminal subunit
MLDIKLYEDFWHLVGHKSELQASGDFIRFEIAANEIVIFNDHGQLVAFDNRCPHRGTRFYTDDSGNKSATCPYHGWTYKKGQLGIPDAKRFTNCDVKTASINQYKIEYCGNFIFVGIKPKHSLYEQLGKVATLVEAISFNIENRYDFNRYQYECYWPLAIENALEPYHVAMVHPNTLGSLDLGETENHFDEFNISFYLPIGNTKVFKQLTSLQRFFATDFQHKGYMSIYIFPFTMLSSTFGYSYSLQNFFPGKNASDKTNFTSRLFTSHLASNKSREIVTPFFDSTVKINRRIFEEDHNICRLMPTDSWSAQPLKFASEVEIKIDHFRALCRKYL